MSTAGEISGRKAPRYYSEPRSHVRDGLDFYPEPPWCVDLLLDREDFIGRCWDPCAGSGTIPKCLAAREMTCHASDIVDRGYHAGLEVRDFTGPILADGPPFVGNIICNPPYRQAATFIEIALTLAKRKVAALVQAKFLYSQRRHKLFTEHPPARIYILSSRPSMPPGDKLMAGTVRPEGGKMDFCWVVWVINESGATTVHWLKR